MKYKDETLSYFAFVEGEKWNKKSYLKIWKSIEYFSFHIILLDNNIYYLEIADGWTVPKYVRDNIKKYMMKNHQAIYLYDALKKAQ